MTFSENLKKIIRVGGVQFGFTMNDSIMCAVYDKLKAGIKMHHGLWVVYNTLKAGIIIHHVFVGFV